MRDRGFRRSTRKGQIDAEKVALLALLQTLLFSIEKIFLFCNSNLVPIIGFNLQFQVSFLRHSIKLILGRKFFKSQSSRWLRLLSNSKLSRNLSLVSSSLCLHFSKRIIAWCPCTPEPKQFNNISKIFSEVCRWYFFLAITKIRTVPSRLLVSALHCCLSDKSSSSKCSFIEADLRTIEGDLRFKVILLVIVLFFFLGFCSIACTRSHGIWKKVSQKVFFTLSENDEDVPGFSVTPSVMVLSVGDLVVATFSVEISDSSDISSRSRVPVEVAKSWPCSTGVDSLAYPGSHTRQGPDGPLFLTLTFVLLRTFDS